MAPEGNWMQAGIFGISVCIVSALAAFAQTSGRPAEFEVASVKVNTVGANEAWRGRENVGNTPASLTMQNVRLRTAMAWAYRVQGAQISGPTWLESERYDIFAKAASAVGEEQIRLMLQKLLADRFKLTFHRNTREISAYVLVVAKGGLKVHESTGEGVKQEDVPGILAQAIEEQLGLRLESRRTAIEMLMVDHAEMTPVEN